SRRRRSRTGFLRARFTGLFDARRSAGLTDRTQRFVCASLESIGGGTFFPEIDFLKKKEKKRNSCLVQEFLFFFNTRLFTKQTLPYFVPNSHSNKPRISGKQPSKYIRKIMFSACHS